mgnify:CR=1 FL=1
MPETPHLTQICLAASLATLVVTSVRPVHGPHRKDVRLAHATDSSRLRRIFAVFLTLVALNMLREAPGW